MNTVLEAPPTAATAGRPIELIARVLSSIGSPQRQIRFYDGSAKVGSGSLNALRLVEVTPNLSIPGSYVLTAVYAGNASFRTSTSATVIITMKPASSITIKGTSQRQRESRRLLP